MLGQTLSDRSSNGCHNILRKYDKTSPIKEAVMGREYQVDAVIPICGKVKQELDQRFVVYKAMVMLSSQRVLPSCLFLVFHCLDWPSYVTLFVFDLKFWPQGFVVEGSEMSFPRIVEAHRGTQEGMGNNE